MGENVKPNAKPDDPEQSKRFEEAARLLEVDETGTAFKKAIDLVVPAKLTRSQPETKKSPADTG